MSRTSTLEPPAEATIDPRIRARRIEVRRGEGRRRLGRLVEVGIVLGVAAVFVAALFTPLLDVDEVVVTGVDPARAELVADAAGIDLGTPLVAADLHEAGTRVAALPWVAEASLSRGIDGTVSVAVVERVPVAAVSGADGALAVDVEGRVLGPASPSASAALPVLEGVAPVPPGAYLPEGVGEALEIAAEAGASLPGVVAAIDPADLVGTLAQGGRVRFGGPDRLDAKLRSLTTVLAQVDLACLAEIDLRLPGSPVLTREEGCS